MAASMSSSAGNSNAKIRAYKRWLKLYRKARCIIIKRRVKAYGSIIEKCWPTFKRTNRTLLEMNSCATRISNSLWTFSKDPNSSLPAHLFSMLIFFWIIVSIVSFVVDSIPSMSDLAIWYILEINAVVIFTIEYVLALISCPYPRRFVLSALNLIDLAAILPFYCGLLLGDTNNSLALLRSGRLIRVFRIIRIPSIAVWMKLFRRVIALSLYPLSMVAGMLVVVCILLASVAYFSEEIEPIWDETQQSYIKPSQQTKGFISIPEAAYFCMSTFATVGYGDIVPGTFLGKIVAAVVQLSGILFFAIPISIVSQNFKFEYSRIRQRQNRSKEQMAPLALERLQNHLSEPSIRKRTNQKRETLKQCQPKYIAGEKNSVTVNQHKIKKRSETSKRGQGVWSHLKQRVVSFFCGLGRRRYDRQSCANHESTQYRNCSASRRIIRNDSRPTIAIANEIVGGAFPSPKKDIKSSFNKTKRNSIETLQDELQVAELSLKAHLRISQAIDARFTNIAAACKQDLHKCFEEARVSFNAIARKQIDGMFETS